MTTREKIAVMQAFIEDEQIEFRYKSGGEWTKIANPVWNWSMCDYRVAPTKKRVPLTFSDMQERVLNGKTMWIKTDETRCDLIVKFEEDYVEGLGILLEYNELLKEEVTFADGEPCWKEAANE